MIEVKNEDGKLSITYKTPYSNAYWVGLDHPEEIKDAVDSIFLIHRPLEDDILKADLVKKIKEAGFEI